MAGRRFFSACLINTLSVLEIARARYHNESLGAFLGHRHKRVVNRIEVSRQ